MSEDSLERWEDDKMATLGLLDPKAFQPQLTPDELSAV